ncbi:MAG TPA: DUF1302 family protein, partial [Myxococcota bacterium]|nr:DUF1302 family protein [Myxococcota bacterium]
MAWRTVAITALLLGSTTARAQELTWGGAVQSDIRARPEEKALGGWYNRAALPTGVSRNMNLFKLRLRADGARIAATADLDFLWLGFPPQVRSFDDLAFRERIDPYRLKAHAAYIDIHDAFVPGLDLRIGQQLVNWGKGDQFNPTNNINANDFEDPLLFGVQLANAMIRADYAMTDTWSLSAVAVPIFKPAVLPTSASLGLSDTARYPFLEPSVRQKLTASQHFARVDGLPTRVTASRINVPAPSFDNIQAALRLAGSLMNQDVALSYYYGRTD